MFVLQHWKPQFANKNLPKNILVFHCEMQLKILSMNL